MDAFRALFEERFGGEDVAALTRGMSTEELAAMPPFPFPKFLFPKGTFPDGLTVRRVVVHGAAEGQGVRRRTRRGRVSRARERVSGEGCEEPRRGGRNADQGRIERGRRVARVHHGRHEG